MNGCIHIASRPSQPSRVNNELRPKDLSSYIPRGRPSRSLQQGAKSQQGVVLLESLIAILLFSMGILALVGLQSAMIKSGSDAKYRAEAAFIAQQRLGAMWADPANLANYIEAATDISALLPNGTRTVTLPAANGEVSVMVTWQQPGQTDVHNFTTNARITGG